MNHLLSDYLIPRSTHSPPPLPPPLVFAPPDWGGVLAGESQLCPDACTLPCFYPPSLEENCCSLVNVCPAPPMFLFPPEPHFKHTGYNSTLSKPVLLYCVTLCMPVSVLSFVLSVRCIAEDISIGNIFLPHKSTQHTSLQSLSQSHDWRIN